MHRCAIIFGCLVLLAGCGRMLSPHEGGRSMLSESENPIVNAAQDVRPDRRVALRPVMENPLAEDAAIKIARETIEFRERWPKLGWSDQATFMAGRWNEYWLVVVTPRDANPPGHYSVAVDAQGNVVSYLAGW